MTRVVKHQIEHSGTLFREQDMVITFGQVCMQDFFNGCLDLPSRSKLAQSVAMTQSNLRPGRVPGGAGAEDTANPIAGLCSAREFAFNPAKQIRKLILWATLFSFRTGAGSASSDC